MFFLLFNTISEFLHILFKCFLKYLFYYHFLKTTKRYFDNKKLIFKILI